ncbi:MAG: oligosaccharide flippase family protein [bacterium]
MKTTAKRVSVNAVSNFVAVAADMLIAMLLLSFILRMMSAELYGIWAIVGGLFAYSTLLELGINSAVNYYIPGLIQREDHDGVNRIVSTAVFFYLIGGGLVLLATVVLVFQFPVWFRIEPEHADISRVVIALVGVFFAISIPMHVFSGVMSGLQRYVPMTMTRLICRVGRAVLIILTLSLGYGLVGLAVAHVVTRLTEAIAMPLWARRYLPQLRVRFSLTCLSTFRQMVSYSIYTLLWSMSTTLQMHAAMIIIGLFLNTAAATTYQIPVMMMGAMYGMVQAFSAVTKPAASALQAEQDNERIEILVLRGARYVVAVMIPLVATLAVFARPIITIWVGQQYEHAAQILWLLVLPQVAALGQTVVPYVLIGLGKHKQVGRFTISMSALSVVAMVLAAGVWRAGLPGVALATSLPVAVTGFVFLPVYVCRVLGINHGRYWATVFLRPLVASLPFLVGIVLANRFIAPATIVSLGTVGLASIPVLAGGYYFLLLTGEERRLVGRWLHRSR